MGRPAAQLVGERFGRLVVLQRDAESLSPRPVWICRCDCGGTHRATTGNLRHGQTLSCGCLHRETGEKLKLRHGMDRGGKVSTEYQTYMAAKQRCTNPRHIAFKYYGARGVRFMFGTFEQFIAELGPRPTNKHSIDRIDPAGNYEPGNVRWATRDIQRLNQRRMQAHA